MSASSQMVQFLVRVCMPSIPSRSCSHVGYTIVSVVLEKKERLRLGRPVVVCCHTYPSPSFSMRTVKRRSDGTVGTIKSLAVLPWSICSLSLLSCMMVFLPDTHLVARQ